MGASLADGYYKAITYPVSNLSRFRSCVCPGGVEIFYICGMSR